MRINIKFIYLLLGIGITYFTDKLFIEVLVGKGSPLQMPYTRIVWIMALCGSIYLINYMSSFMRTWYIIIFMYFLYLIIESLAFYGNPFQYPRVFSKIIDLFVIFYVYAIYKKFQDKVTLETVVYFITIFFILNALLVNRDAFSLSSFESHDRGLSAESVYLLIIPFLYFVNKYFAEKHIMSLFYSIFFFMSIIFLQHRTVWVTTVIALALNFQFFKKANIKLELNGFIPIIVIGAIGAFFATFFILSNNDIVAKLNENINDIMNPTSRGTGNWRMIQFTSYLPFLIDNFMFGMRLEGFELPIQFFDRDVLAFEDGTGHHFHSFYVDRIFYFGIIGLALAVIPPIYYIFSLVVSIKVMKFDRIALLAYMISAIIYGISYKLQLNVYATLGFLIYMLETDSLNQQVEEPKEIKQTEEIEDPVVA